MIHLRLPLLLLLTTLFLAACEKPSGVDRSGRLLLMAGEEAANITNKLDRLSRQLNIANTQLNSGRTTDADKTLLLARDTLTAANADKTELDDFHRIAAWTSISQLARRAGDRDLALKSSDLALAALNDVQPAAERSQYVLSLASELAELRDKTSAIELVISGGTWAGDIVDANLRRQALLAFTDRLLYYESFENARTMLRHDPDPVWRTDTFLILADTASGYYNRRYGLNVTAAMVGRGGGGAGGTGASMREQSFRQADPPAQTYGKDVRFEQVFRQSTPGN